MIPNKLNYLNPYSFEYDDKGRITCIKNDRDEQRYEYDEKNRCILHTSNFATKIYEYDDNDRIIKEEYYFGNKINIDTLRHVAYYKYISDYVLTEYIHTDGVKDYEVHDLDGNPINRYKISNNYKCASQFKYNKDKTEWVYYEYESATGYYDGRLSKVNSNHSRTIIPINQISDNNYENHLKSILFVESIYFRIMGELDRILDDYCIRHDCIKDQFKDTIIFADYHKLEKLIMKDEFNTVPILSFNNFPKSAASLIDEEIMKHFTEEIRKIMTEYPVRYAHETIFSPDDDLYYDDTYSLKIICMK